MSNRNDQELGWRQRSKKRTTFRHVAITILALALCIGTLGAALYGTFRVRHVQVVGSNLPAEAIVEAANVSGQNVFTVRSDEVVSRVATLREIVVQRVESSFPDTVTIYARPRISVVAWQSGKILYELDPNGNVVRESIRTRLPIIQSDGTRRAPGPGIVQAVYYAVRQLPAAPRGAVASFRLESKRGLVIVGSSGWTADVGRGTPQILVNRIAKLTSFLYRIQNDTRTLSYVDLRPRAPYARFAGA